MINTAGTLQGLVDVLKQLEDPKKISQFISLLVEVSKELTEEILNQKSLLAAEQGELALKKHAFYLFETLRGIVMHYREHELALNKKINFDEGHCEVTLYTDPVLMKRVIANMIKNALEATHVKDEVNVGCKLGTYSMKLLSEKYLDGKVYFSSNSKEGTVFYLRLPLKSPLRP